MQKLLPGREWSEITQCAGAVDSHDWESDTQRSSAISVFYPQSSYENVSVRCGFAFENRISNQVQ